MSEERNKKYIMICPITKEECYIYSDELKDGRTTQCTFATHEDGTTTCIFHIIARSLVQVVNGIKALYE